MRIEPPICRARRRWVNETSGADRRRVRAARRRAEIAEIADRFRREKGRGSGLAAEALAAVCAALRAGGVDTLIVGDLEDATVVTGEGPPHRRAQRRRAVRTRRSGIPSGTGG